MFPSHYPPPYQPRTLNQPQRPPLNQPQSSPAIHPIPNITLNTNQNTNRGRNFPKKKKPVEFTPIMVSYAELLSYLLDNAMAVITAAKIPQPQLFRGYNSNATCAYHGGVLGHSIEHCMTLKHKEERPSQRVNLLLSQKIEPFDLKIALAKFTPGKNNLDIILGKQRCVFNKARLGYNPKNKKNMNKNFLTSTQKTSSPFLTCFYYDKKGHSASKCYIKANIEAMKEQMTKMMEAMMSMRKMMEVNTAIIGVACIATEVDSIHPFGFSRVGCPVSDVVGQGGKVEENACGPNYVKVQSKHSFLPYGLPPNYTPPTVVYALGNNNQQPQPDHAHAFQPMGETHEAPQDHTLAGSRPHPGYATKGHAFPSAPEPIALGRPQWRDLAAQVAPLMMERDDNNDNGCIAGVTCLQVFASERIELGLRRGKFDYVATLNNVSNTCIKSTKL
ncbi:hypothetical protein HKD37_15G043562 [Glycine soja]